MVKSGKVLSVPVVMGFASEEKIGMVPEENQLRQVLKEIDENLEVIVSEDMHLNDSDSRKEMALKILEMYTGGEPFADNLGAAVRVSFDISSEQNLIVILVFQRQFPLQIHG